MDDQPGGGRPQQFDARNVQKPPPAVRDHQLAATSEGYRRQAQLDGIPGRPAGLFPPGDALLAALARLPGSWPFEKHLPGLGSSYQLLPGGGWVTGDSACAAGLDLRLFYQPPAPGEQWATLQGAVRLGDGAAIGTGFFMGAHGGAIESVLDEATAELAKVVWKPMVRAPGGAERWSSPPRKVSGAPTPARPALNPRRCPPSPQTSK